MKRHLLLPVVGLIVLVVIVMFYFNQSTDKNNSRDEVSSLIFGTPDFYNNKSINENTLGEFYIVNFFASWCSPCKIEHPLFFEIRKKYPELYLLGFNHKDPTSDAKKYLKDDGNPYDFVGVDSDGLIALEFGVFGLPETYLINEDGKIIYKFMGPITMDILKNEIEPLL